MKLGDRGLAATVGYFQAESDSPDTIVAACRAVMQHMGPGAAPARLSVKAPPLGFCAARLRTLAEAAAAADMRLMFDAHAPADADATLAAVEVLLPDFPGTGCVLPARWRRSLSDADHWRDTSAPIRVVKGEWRDPGADAEDIDAAFLALVSRLAGRAAPVAVATHQPALAERALDLLIAAGTPCELEQLRGLPRRRTVAAARRRGVPVRIYIPFGPDWWPYAIDKALARPHLPLWMLRDALGLRDRAKQMGRPG